MKTRKAVVDLICSWEGKKESDGSFKSIIDIYNTLKPLPRSTKMQYTWEWCAATWSALAAKLGYTDIMPTEMSCYYLIEKAKKMGIWVESDSYVPNPADAVLYDWDDNTNYASTDNKGTPDHVGTVIEVNKTEGYMVVMEGNYSQSVKRRKLNINGRYIRGFICPKYDADGTSSKPSTPSTPNGAKSITTLAKEVIAGKWGSGTARKEALTKAGYDYTKVQTEVNKLLKGSTTTSEATITKIAKEVIAGKWGVGVERKQRLTSAGYNYNIVQKKVNELLK